jgi:hypothetical protein
VTSSYVFDFLAIYFPKIFPTYISVQVVAISGLAIFPFLATAICVLYSAQRYGIKPRKGELKEARDRNLKSAQQQNASWGEHLVFPQQYKPQWDSDFDLPYFYKEFQTKVISKKFLKRNLEDFKQVAKSEACSIENEDLESLSLENSVFVRNSRELQEQSHKVSDRTRPILAYYAHQQYVGFFMYTLFKYPRTTGSSGHGLSIDWGEGKNTSIDKIGIRFQEDGFFRRLVDTFTILGRPNAYSKWLPFKREGKYVFVENDLDSRIKIGKVDLLSMMNFDSKTFGREICQRFPEQGVYPDSYDKLLTDFCLLFAASNIARYRPQLWERILEGLIENEAMFNRRMKIVYEMTSLGETNFQETANYLQSFHYQIWGEFWIILRSE